MTNKEFYQIFNLLRASFGRYSCWKGNNADEIYPMFEDEDFEKIRKSAQWFIKNSNDAPTIAELLHFKPKSEGVEEAEREVERDKYGCAYIFHTNNDKLDSAIVEFIHLWMDVKHLREDDEHSERGIKEMLEYITEIIKDSYSLDSLADSIMDAVSDKSLKVSYRRYIREEK